MNDESEVKVDLDQADETFLETERKMLSLLDQLKASLSDAVTRKGGVPTIVAVERLWKEYRSKTREIDTALLTAFFESVDEAELIASKKENSKEKA